VGQAFDLIDEELDVPDLVPEDEVLRTNPFRSSWFVSFMKRHEEKLKFVRPRPLEIERRNVADLEVFYERVSALLDQYKVPRQLYANFDETMLKALSKTLKVVTTRAAERPSVPINDKVAHITLGCCVFADGNSLIPLAILDRKYVPTNVPASVKAGFHWASQKSGWITTQIFHEYVSEVFIPHIEEQRFIHGLQGRWALLLVGHSSRANPVMLQECFRHQILVVTYVAHSSPMCQVLDRGSSEPLKPA